MAAKPDSTHTLNNFTMNRALHAFIGVVSLLVYMSLSLPLQGQTRESVFNGYCHSLSFLVGTASSAGFNFEMLSTSYDGSASSLLFDTDASGYAIFSNEVSPSFFEPGVYRTDYALYVNSKYNAAGTISMTLPTVDADQNGIADFLQKNKSGNGSASGKLTRQLPSLLPEIATSGQMLRSAGSIRGTYSATGRDPQVGDITYRGTLYLLNLLGKLKYNRTNSTAIVEADLESERGLFYTITSSLQYSVTDVNTISFAASKFTSPNQLDVFTKPFVLKRTGNRYLGRVDFEDGNRVTSWPDYTAWQFEIVDTNDSDSDGVPDLSDPPVVQSPPMISVQTGSQTKTVGEAVSFTVQASGSGVLSYSWRKNGVPLLNVGGVSGANGPTLSFASVQASHAGAYSVVVSNLVGSVVSAIVQLTVNPAEAAPTIVAQPVSAAVRMGQQVTLVVQAAGSSPLSYQWQRNGANLPGTTGAELVIRSTTLNDAGEYRVVVSNSRGSVTSAPAFVAVLAPEYLPTITQQPQGTNLVVGQRLELKVISNGNPEPGYQWRKDGVNLLGGNGSVLVKPSVVLTDAGLYQVAVTNSVGQVLSARVTVTVVPETIVSRIVGFREIVGGDLDFDLDAPSGREWVLEDSTILGTWSEVSRFLANQPRFSLRVPRQPTSRRFFRLRQADSGSSAPVIIKQPEGLTVQQGSNAVFTVETAGTGTLAHQWLFNGVAILGSRQATLILTNAQATNTGDYQVVVSNSAGNVTSSVAKLTVIQAQPVGPAGFVWIPSGTFVMGSPVSEADRDSDEFQHTVTLTQGFWMSDHETTQAEYEAVIGSNPSNWRGLNLPVEQVSWNDAVTYCQKMTERERAAGRITAQQAYRLPTEAEWEYAARAGTAGARYGEPDAIAWHGENSGSKTQAVKQKPANAWGLYDMLGNVWEWCSDWIERYPTGSVTDPMGPSSGSSRVCRGGSSGNVARFVRSANRTWVDPGNRGNVLGFRPVLSSAPVVPAGMALIPAGPFQMGDDRVDYAVPVHTVMVSAFAMDKWEVSIELWESVRVWGNARGYDLVAGGSDGANHPVHSVDWWDVVKWNNARSEKEGKVPAYYVDGAMTQVYRSGDKEPAGVKWNAGYRLPTEAEWEYAARGGVAGKLYPWGTDEISAKLANYAQNKNGSTPVGSYGANGYGLYDMAGNVWEWTWDYWGQYAQTAQTDPRGPSSGSYRVIRGGSWHNDAERCRVSNRSSISGPALRNNNDGFRSALPPGQP